MADPLNLHEPDPKPVTAIRVVAIAALVALVIGCIPALGTALVVADNLNARSRERAVDACKILADGRRSANERNKQMKINLQADIQLFEFVRKAQPKKVPPGSQVSQKTLDQYLAKLDRLIEVKKTKVLPLTKPLSIPNCEKQVP